MNGFFATFLPFFIACYIITIGFGLILGKEKGVATVNRFWLRTLRWAIIGLRKSLNWSLGELAKLLK